MTTLNKTEQMALEWLKTIKGYKQTEIFKSNKSPDFICSDKKRYEVKYLYTNKLIFSEKQINTLLPSDIILVFNDNGFVKEFLWEDKDKTPFKIIVPHYFEIKLYLNDEETRKDLKHLIIDFGTADKAMKAVVLAHKSGIFKTKFA